ncbi:MAG: HAD family hydrolase [Solirubrobacteraceae bacterium]
MLGLPNGITACLFDLDGVLTPTAKVHAKAWKQMFDAYLRERADRDGEPFHEFALPDDYETYVDGKPRSDGVRSFLQSRNIDLPEGSPTDTPDDETIYGLGLRKNELVTALIHDEGVEPYEGSVRFVEAARDQGAVFEDAEAGVAAGHAGHFGWVVGVDRTDHARALHAHGADVVVEDLSELLDRP